GLKTDFLKSKKSDSEEKWTIKHLDNITMVFIFLNALHNNEAVYFPETSPSSAERQARGSRLMLRRGGDSGESLFPLSCMST
ncbi:hypothetical protein KI387_009720, partial [Taxus chinensis]